MTVHKLTMHITVTALVTVNVNEPVMCDIQSLSCGKAATKVLLCLGVVLYSFMLVQWILSGKCS